MKGARRIATKIASFSNLSEFTIAAVFQHDRGL